MLRFRLALCKACERHLQGESTPEQTEIRPMTVGEMLEADCEIVKSVHQQSFAIEVAAI